MHVIDGTTSKAKSFYNLLDAVVPSLKDQFNQSSFLVYENIESLLLKTLKSKDTTDESEYIKWKYNDEINITKFEIEADVLSVIFYVKKVDCFDSFFSEIRTFPRDQRLLLPCTVHICKVLLVNPATTSTAEQLFSTARRIKTCMRSKMIPVRINALSILHTLMTLRDSLYWSTLWNFFAKKVEEGVYFSDDFKFVKDSNTVVNLWILRDF